MLLTIFLNITLPVFLLIAVGILTDRTLKIDLSTLTRLSFNVLLPALVFIKTLDANLSPAVFGGVAAVNITHTVLLFLVTWGIFSLPSLKSHRPIATLAAVTPNAGNYGIPLAALAYGTMGANVMAIIVMIQIFFTITAGIWIADSGKSNLRQMALGFLKIPLLWVTLLAIILAALHIQLPAPIRTSAEYLSNGLVPVALITLGAQLSRSRASGETKLLSIVSVIRLFFSPLLAFGLLAVWQAVGGTKLGIAGPVLVIAAGMPVAVNVFILAAEYSSDSQLASQTIFWTTAISVVTLTGWLALLQ
jgi:predicted permease